MITSMTGFGSANLENEKISLSVQIKTVNGRFLETRFRMPREYSALENDMKRLLAKELQRGSVEVAINRVLSGKGQDVAVQANVALAKGWIKAVQNLAQELNMPANVTLDNVLRVPDVVSVGDSTNLPEWEKSAVLAVLTKALEACVGERRREGQELARVLEGLLAQLEKFVESVQTRKKKLDQDLKEKLNERLRNIDPSVAVDPNRLAQEVVFLLDKADIAEELARAATHIKAYRNALRETGSVGKKLDFYTQELHREVNTMGSKTQALEVTLDVIEAKTCVERLREQVQNVE